MRISDWSSDVCSSDLVSVLRTNQSGAAQAERERHAVFSILGGVLVVQLVVDALLTPDMTLSSLDSVGSLAVILRIVTAVSILLLIHYLYLSATPASRLGLRLLSVGLGRSEERRDGKECG